MEEEQLKQKYMQMKMLEEQIEKIQEQVQSFDKQAQELETIKSGLEGTKSVKEGSEILVPVTPGIFAKAKITDTKNFIVNVGANTSVTRTADEAIKMVNEQIAEIEKLKKQFVEQLEQMIATGKQLEQEMRTMVEQHMAEEEGKEETKKE